MTQSCNHAKQGGPTDRGSRVSQDPTTRCLGFGFNMDLEANLSTWTMLDDDRRHLQPSSRLLSDCFKDPLQESNRDITLEPSPLFSLLLVSTLPDQDLPTEVDHFSPAAECTLISPPASWKSGSTSFSFLPTLPPWCC